MDSQAKHDINIYIEKMLHEQGYATLATLRQQQPFQHMICHAFSNDLRNIYFASQSNNALSINIADQPLVNIMWDNRTGDVEDQVLDAYLTATGFCSKLSDTKSRMAKSLLLARNPLLSEYFDKPLLTVYCAQIHTYHYHYGNGNTDFFYPNQQNASTASALA